MRTQQLQQMVVHVCMLTAAVASTVGHGPATAPASASTDNDDDGTSRPDRQDDKRIFFDDIFGSVSYEPEEKLPVSNCTCNCGVANQEIRIVGGRPTGVHKYPWVAKLMYESHFHCGGSLINSDYVLTAAHCVRNNMQKSGWYIVKFLNENTIETIPSCWMVNFNKCLWPTTLSFSKISLAIKSCLKPSKNSKEWKYCEVKVLSKKLLTNFNEASKLTNKFLTQSSTEAESYLPKKMLKKRKKNIKKRDMASNNEDCSEPLQNSSSSCSNSDESDSSLPLLPTFSKTDKIQTINADEYISTNDVGEINTVNNLFTLDVNSSPEDKTGNTNKNSVLDNLLADDNWINNVSIINNNEDNIILNSSVQMKNNDVNTDSVRTIPNYIQEDPAEVQKQIIRQLVTINARMKEQGEYLHTILMIVSDVQEKQKTLVQPITAALSNHHEFENVYKMLPVLNEDSLNSLANILCNDTLLYDQTANMLSKIGGSNYREFVRRVMRKLITDEFAKFYSYTGHKGNKKAFNKTVLCTLLLKAVHSSSFNTTTNKDIETVTSIWLTKANERLKTTLITPADC